MIKKLSELALLIPEAKILGNDVEISGIEHDSRKVTAKNLFVCMEGAHVDGHNFIPQAVDGGAVAVLTARQNFTPPENISALVVPDMLNALAVIVPYFYDYPARAMRVVGVTGTNGKTTTTYMLREIFSTAGLKVGVIGTIQILIGDESFPNPNTTPNVIDLQHVFADMRAKNVQVVVMEVSSHALAENRVAGVEFDTAIFTNLTQDHLDFHGTMENYLRAKAKLFDMVSRKGRKQNKSAVVNVDDAAGEEILRHCHCKKISYAIENPADLQAIDLNVKSDGMKLQLNSSPVPSPLSLNLHVTGLFNVYNVLATIGAALAENISPEVIKRALENFHGVPGRFERIFSSAPFEVIVDYAHTPDGVKNVLETARQIVTGKIITVFGCGGDRDNKKRPIMGKLAAELSDVVIATSDNPRTENPEKILDDIERGIREVIGEKIYERIADRRAAIFRAIELANSGDVVLILGKGHENYQILNTGTIHFDDREVAREVLGLLTIT